MIWKTATLGLLFALCVPANFFAQDTVRQGALIHVAQPVYPEQAKAAGISGTVSLHALISEDGSVQQVEFVSGPDTLRQAAVDAVKQWRYQPMLFPNNRPVSDKKSILMVFSLRKSNDAEPYKVASSINVGSGTSAQGQSSTTNPATSTSSAPPAPPGFPVRIRVGGAIQDQNIVHSVPPVYPEAAITQNISGAVVVHMVVARDGFVQTAESVSGPDELKDPAVGAVKQWRYRPTMLNGHSVEVDTMISIDFVGGT